MSRREMQGGFRPPKSDAKDLVEKDFMAFPDVAADVVNALLYDGEHIVSAAELLPAPTETLYSGNSDKNSAISMRIWPSMRCGKGRYKRCICLPTRPCRTVE
ncbi:MAG: hypothetical protein K2I21_02630 [Acetatifactor sp.]|nr:hypothetical protein [Acetatifactor sp.]